MTIDRADIQNIYPLTPLQEGMYFHAESAPSSEAYFEQWSLRIAGELRPDLVRAAWADLFARHEVFRSVFTPGDGKRPLQIVLRRREVDISTKDLSAFLPAQQELALAAERERDRARGFRLGSDPLVRVLLVRLSDREWEIIWSHHHIILDGWSAALVQSEFMRLYAAAYGGHDAMLEPVRPFSSFVKALPETADFEVWRDYLAGSDAAAEIPHTESSRPSELARSLVELSAETSARVEAFCRDAGVTLGSFVQAVWGIVLGRYADADDVVFGWVMSGRAADLPGVERMVGLLINTVPIKIRLRVDETFRELVVRLQRDAAELIAHQHTPLIAIQRACGGAARFSHVVTVENYPIDEEVRTTSIAETGFAVRSATSYDRTHYGFDLVVLPGRDALRLRLSWDRARHDDELMTRIGGQLAHVITSVLQRPDVQPCRLNILPPDQWEAAVVEPNRTAAGYPADATIVDAFDAQAKLHPSAPAVLAPHDSDRWLTYGELHGRAAAIAAHLRYDLQIAAGSRIALVVRPSAEAIVGILGILKAGGSYVPIDPGYPVERVKFLLDDSRVAAILTLTGDHVNLPPVDVPIVALDSCSHADARPLSSVTTPDDAAYVIYTSGSTGTPKGCAVTHRNVMRLIVNDRPHVEIRPSDVWILAHSLSFDFSVWEIFGPLLHGARLVVPTREIVRDPSAFRELLSRYRVTVLNQTPLAFANLVAVEEDAAEHTLGEHLRCVIFGGDRLDVGALRPWLRHYPIDSTMLINMYGITETTVHVTSCRLTPEQILAPSRHSPLGRPLPETTVYLCDRHLNPQPIGARGEMLVGGTGVCLGYLDRPELTAQRFVPDAFGGSGRLYRSGDLAYRDTSGNLYFAGRNDGQVKVRGHRIEPAEIEHALLALEGVAQAAILVEPGPSGDELIACVNGRSDPEVLRAELAQRLPEYAVPGSFVLCEALPLTANGKLDRAALRALRTQADAAERSTFAAPATAREQILADVWAAVLGTARVGRHDRFISLGGDSIKSIQILARLRARGLTLALKDLFRYPTIAELAPMLTERGAGAATTDASAPFALTPIQRRFFETHPVDRAHFDHALILRCERPIDPRQLRLALQALYDTHGALRLRFQERADGTWSQRVIPRGEPVAFTVVDLSGEPDPGAAAERHASEQQTSLDISAGPLFRATLYRRADADRLLLVAHHLSVDGVSWQFILDDLTASLSGATPFPPTDTFGQWSTTLHEANLRQRLAAELPYWRRLDEPLDDTWQPLFPAGTYANAGELLSEWSRSDTIDLVRRACAAYQTNAGELLMAAAARALGRWTGRRRLQIALEGHGRDAVSGCDLSRTVGWFTALHPFVLELDDRPVGRRIRQLKEDLRRIPSGGAGYGILRYLSAIPEAAMLRARPHVSFNYLGELDAGRLGGWFSPSSDPIGAAVSPRGPRPFALEIAAIVIGERLRLSISYPAAEVPEASIRELQRALEEELRIIVEHCVSRKAPELTPADLTHKDLTLDEFESLFDDD